MTDVVSGSGRSIRLGREVGRGGEGSVFEVDAEPTLVAKIFHSVLAEEKAEKIRVMAGMRTDRIERLTAWPLDLLSRRSGEAVGVLMPRVIGHRLVHELYSPKSRRHTFERGDWRFLIRAAANTARAFAVVHDAGCVIGDVNQGGILVADDASVRLIDCDSFQVIAGARQFLCDVGMETFTPPELQGKPFHGVVRTQNHDNFGLAVLVFLMLFMGRHPFAGRFLGQGDMPIGKAIAQGRFAYGPRQALTQMEKPPGAPDLAIVGDHGALFERAFTPVAASGGRPTAREWVNTLTQLERSLMHCVANPSHWYLKTLGTCPWCLMESEVGIPLFPLDITQVPGSLFNIDALWREIAGIGHPGPLPTLEHTPIASSTARTTGRIRKLRTAGGILIGGGVLAFGLADPALEKERWLFAAAAALVFIAIRLAFARKKRVAAFATGHNRAAGLWQTMREDWVRQAGPQDFDARLAELRRLDTERSAVAGLRQEELEKLRVNQHAVQLDRFLDQSEVTEFSGISDERKQMLASYGMESAADVTPEKLSRIPQLGWQARSRLIRWRQKNENEFVFDPGQSIDPQDLARVEQENFRRRWQIESAMVKGVADLQTTKARIETARQSLIAEVSRTQREYLQTLVDYKTARG